jgi:TonB family protein
MFRNRCRESVGSGIGRALSSLLLLFLPFGGVAAPAGQTPNAETSPRAKVAVKPEYSSLARQLRLKGLVRVEVLIGTDGRVKKAHVLGGHPVLALDAQKAALVTAFETASTENTQVLEFRFDPTN